MIENCYNCLYYETCKPEDFTIDTTKGCDLYRRNILKGNKFKHDDHDTLITTCHWCRCDIKIENWAERYREWEGISHLSPQTPPKQPYYLCEDCYDKASSYSSSFWYRYICADEKEYNAYENEYNNYWNMPHIGGYSSGEIGLLSKLKQLVEKYSGDFNTNKYPIVKSGG